MLTYKNFDEAVALDQVQAVQQALGTGIINGGTASLPADTAPITVDVVGGTAYIANTEVSYTAGSVTLPDGDAQLPRKDVIYVDSNGALDSVQGTPRAPKDGTDNPGTDRTVYQPEPPDMSSLSSIADGAPIAEVWVPSADMTDSSVEYLRDRRLRPWASALLTSGTIGVNDLDFDPATQSELDSHASTVDAHRTDENIRDTVGAMAADGLVHDDPNDELGLDIVATGPETLSGGEFEVDLGESASTSSKFTVHIGNTNGATVAAEKGETSGGNHAITLVETSTSIGNPTIGFVVTRIS